MTTIVVVGGDLFRIALQHLGEASRWLEIAELNDLTDPVLEGVVTLQLPETRVPSGGGSGQ